MNAAQLEALAAAARNRGLKLIRSRVRNPGNRRFGKVGLSDASGNPLFGVDSDGPTASIDEVEAYLRKIEAKDWGASVGARGRSRSNRPKPPSQPRANSQRVAASRQAALSQKVRIRNARSTDIPRLIELIRELGADVDEGRVRSNLALLRKNGETPLVATIAGEVVGLCGLGRRVAIHRPAPLGRITVLVVRDEVRGKGIGRLLVEAAEHWMRLCGCYLVEVTSNDRMTAAHAFYRHMGYQGTSIRFAKSL